MDANTLSATTVNTYNIIETQTPLNDFMMEGTALIALWGDGEGTISMNTEYFSTESALTMKDLADNLNDGSFGCQYIISAKVFIFQSFNIQRVLTNLSTNEVSTEYNTKWVEIFVGTVIPERTQGKSGISSAA